MNEQKPNQPEIIRITEAEIDAANKNEADLSQINTTHAFDRPKFLEFLKSEFPDFFDQIQEAARPGQSSHADEMEKWEGDWILKRKDIIDGETMWQYLIRLLYEEFFSVNQNPSLDNPPEFDGSYGMTPGGLVSHFSFSGTMNGESIASVAKFPFRGRTLKEGIRSLMTSNNLEQTKKALSLGTIANECTYTNFRTFTNYTRSTRDITFNKIIQNENADYPKEMDSLGYRLLAMLKAEPEMMEPVVDQELLRRFGIKRTMSRVDLIISMWDKFGRIVFDEKTRYRNINEDGVKEALTDLLYARTHPELQIFFKYLSPSGYVNDWLNFDDDK